jgi:hypothetical protein
MDAKKTFTVMSYTDCTCATSEQNELEIWGSHGGEYVSP